MGFMDVYIRKNSYDRTKRHHPQYDAKDRLDRDTMPILWGEFVVAAPDRAFQYSGNTLEFFPPFWKDIVAKISRWDRENRRYVDTPLLESDCSAEVYRYEGECAYCGESIRMLLPNVCFCSNDCASAMQRHNKQLSRPSRAKTPTPTTCAVCGDTFTPKRKGAKTCSTRCRVKAHRQKQA